MTHSKGSQQHDKTHAPTHAVGGVRKQNHRTLPRQRSVKACWSCHFRKIKCDFQQPTCASCRQRGSECLWDRKYYDPGKKESQSRVQSNVNQSSEDGRRGHNRYPAKPCPAGTPRRPNVAIQAVSRRTQPCGAENLIAPAGSDEDSPVNVGTDNSDDSDNPASQADIFRPTPDRDHFGSLNSFMSVVDRLQRIDYNNCPSPLSVQEISNLHVLWDEYVYRRPDRGNLVAFKNTVLNPCRMERLAFYNTACAVIGLAQGSMYLRNGSCQSVMSQAGEMAWALAQQMVDMLAMHNDFVTDDIIKAIFYILKMCVYGSVLSKVNRIGLVNKFIVLLENQNSGKSVHDIQYHMHMILLIRIILDQVSSPVILVMNLKDLISRRRNELREFPPNDIWTWSRYLGCAAPSVLSAQIMIVMFIHKPLNAGRGLIPFGDLIPELQQTVRNQITELQEIKGVLKQFGDLHPPAVSLVCHIEGLAAYLMHYAGVVSDRVALAMLSLPLEIILHDNALDHPFNHCVFISQYLIMSAVFRIDPAVFFRLVKPHMLPLKDPRLTAHGAALNHYLHLMEASPDGGIEATRNLAGLDGVRLFSTPMVRMVGQEASANCP